MTSGTSNRIWRETLLRYTLNTFIYLFIYLLSSKLATEFHFMKTACFSKRHGLEKGASFGSNFSLSQIRSGSLEMVITHILFLHSSGSAV